MNPRIHRDDFTRQRRFRRGQAVLYGTLAALAILLARRA
jgi:hypothetical protein